MRMLRTKLTYANVIATLALFLALGGGAAWAAHRIGANQLKSNSVGTGKIKKNAVTTKKIKAKAVTNAKLADSAVNFAKIAPGTSLIASASGGPVAVNTAGTVIPIPLTGTTSFTPAAGVVNLLNVEVRGINLARTGAETCDPVVQPLVDGQLFQVSDGFLTVASDSSVASNFHPVPLDSETGPVGLSQPGIPQQTSIRVIGDGDCAAGSQVSVALAVTQLK
jgi:hypothetical protein